MDSKQGKNRLLNIVSLNVKGLRDVTKRNAIVEWSKQKGDIIFSGNF